MVLRPRLEFGLGLGEGQRVPWDGLGITWSQLLYYVDESVHVHECVFVMQRANYHLRR